jgi:hypothetical protein
MNLLWGGQHERPSCAILFARQLIRMLALAKPPPNLQFFCNIKAMTVHYKTTEIFSEIKYDSYIL